MLLLVVVIVTIAALIGGAAATSAATERGAAAAAREVAQARLLAWSGVQAAMAELAEQREVMLAGERPVLTESWDLFGEMGERRGVVRLVDLTPGEDGVAVPESGKLCVNTATRQMLVDLGIEEGLAGRIVSARDEGEFGSVEGLLRVRGVTASMLGEVGEDAGFAMSGASSGSAGEDGAGGGSGAGAGIAEAAGTNLSSVLTVFSFDPNIQSGVAEGGERFRGRQRVNLDQPWSSRLEDALIERFGQDAATGVKGIMDEGTTFRTDADVIATLRRIGLPSQSWGDILDVFTTSDDEYLIGRVDLGTAPEAVLAALPGIDEEQAREIVAARERLGPEATASSTWLVTEGILSEDDFEDVVDHVTTRCLQWRVRVEAGMTQAGWEERGIGGPVEEGSGDDAALRPMVVLEAVIDVSSQRARVAYLRDVTLLDAARAVLGDAGLAEALGLAAALGEEEPVEGVEDEPTQEDGAGMEEPWPEDAGGGLGGLRSPPPAWPGEDVSPDPELGGSDAEGRGGTEEASGAAGGGADGGFTDRRIGRWATGGSRGGRGQGGGR